MEWWEKYSETILVRQKVQLSMTIFVRQSQRRLSQIFLSESLSIKMNDIQCYRRKPTEKLLALWLFLGKLHFFLLISIMASIFKASVVNPKVTTVIKNFQAFSSCFIWCITDCQKLLSTCVCSSSCVACLIFNFHAKFDKIQFTLKICQPSYFCY